MTRNRFGTNSLSDLNTSREIQTNRGRREYYNNNREARRTLGIETDAEEIHQIDSNRSAISYMSIDASGISFSSFSSFAQEYGATWMDGGNIGLTCSPSLKEDKPKYIKSYNYKPSSFKFNKLESECDENPLYLGTEIEIDCAGENDLNAKYVNENLENCYTVHDGSLNNGFEIVTHPGTLEYHKTMNYKQVFQWLSDKGYRSHDTRTCGLHIHVNRDYLSKDKTKQDLCITKILFLLEKYWDEVTKIARRRECNYSVKIKRDSGDDSLLDLLYKAKGENGGWGYNAKYNSINLLHKNTIEFRMFKGTIKYETYIATLEFVKNIVDVSKRVPLEDIQSVTFESIINANETEYLIGYINERGIK